MHGHEEAAAPPRLERFSRIEFHETAIRQEEGHEALLGCPRATAWLVVDDDSLRIFAALRRKGSIARAEEALDAETGLEWDAEDLARLLLARGFVRAIDGVPLDASDRATRAERIVFRAPPRGLRWAHHRVVLALGTLVALSWFVLVAIAEGAFPSPRHLQLTAHPGLNIVFAFTAGISFLLLHEGAHYVMARSYGVDARIRVSHRMYMLVAETDCTNAWMLKARQRVPIFLSGIALDLILGALFAFGYLLIERGVWDAVGLAPALLFLQFLVIVPIVYQLLFFAKTDLYYTLLAVTGERRLVDDARTWTRLQAHRLRARLRREPRVPCIACRAPLYEAEPYCARCGEARDAASFPILPAQRRRLAAFSMVLYPGAVVVVTYALATTVLVTYFQGRLGYALLQDGLASSQWLAIAEGAGSLAISLVGIGLLMYFIVRDVARAIRASRPGRAKEAS